MLATSVKKHRGPGPVSWTTKFNCQQI